MIASLIIAQTLVPMLTAWFPSPPAMSRQSWISRLQERYASALTWSLTHRRATAWIIAGVLLVTGGLIAASAAFPDKLLKVAMFTQDAGRQVILDYRIQGTHPIERIDAAVDTVEGFFRARQKELGIERIYTVYQAERAQSVIVLRGDGIKGADFVQRFEKKLPEILIGEPTFNLDDQNGQDEGRFSLQVTACRRATHGSGAGASRTRTMPRRPCCSTCCWRSR